MRTGIKNVMGEISYDDQISNPSLQFPDKHRKINEAEIMNYLPPGVQFKPDGGVLIAAYLIPKVNDEELPPNKFNEVLFYKSDPDQLAEMHKADMLEVSGKYEWYFFSPREKKHKGGRRPNRTTWEGFWRPVGTDKIVRHRGEQIGFRRTLVYHKGNYKGSTKTKWLMEEFRLKDPPAPVPTTNKDDMKLDDWVICKLYKKINGSSSPTTANREVNDQVELQIPIQNSPFFPNPHLQITSQNSPFFPNPDLQIPSQNSPFFQNPDLHIPIQSSPLFPNPDLQIPSQNSPFFENPDLPIASQNSPLFPNPDHPIPIQNSPLFPNPDLQIPIQDNPLFLNPDQQILIRDDGSDYQLFPNSEFPNPIQENYFSSGLDYHLEGLLPWTPDQEIPEITWTDTHQGIHDLEYDP